MKNVEVRMKNLLRLEELAQFIVCILALFFFDVPWWCYLLLLFGPDVSMFGYLVNSKVGATSYNLLHHKGIAVLIAALSWITALLSVHAIEGEGLALVLYVSAIILYGHASMDRIFGYGLKFGDSFHHTHLGWIGKAARIQKEQEIT
ncbi:MAG TPA: DUF4260 domain-containing protein [Flavobacteriales bacterium]|nr:DUF4260 domain-containing protein [Flavobacteriales bacterium]